MPTERTEGDLPDSCFAYVPADGPKSARKLRLCSLETGEPDARDIGNAAAAFSPGGHRGNRVQLPSGAVAPSKAKVRRAWRKANPDKSDDEMPDSIRMSEADFDDEVPEPIVFAGPDGAAELTMADPASTRPLLFATVQEWIAFLPKPGVYRHPRYGEMDLTAEKLARIVANFAANVYGQQPPINAEHDGRASGAVGWIAGMRLAEDGSIEVKPEWNERGRALLDGDRFRYVSAEFYDEWQDPVSGDWHRDVPVGLAICTRPHFKTDVLRPLAASEEAALVMRVGAAPDPEEPMSEKEPTTTTTDAPEPTPAPEGGAPITAGERAVPSVVRQLDEAAALEFAELKRTAKRLEEQNKQLAEDRARLLAESRVKRFTAEVRGASESNGKAYVGDIPDHVRMLCDLEEQFGATSWHVGHYQAINRAHAELADRSSLFREMGVGRGAEATSTAQDQIDALAREAVARTPGKSHAQAFTEILDNNPELRSALARERQEGR